jgi:hypothetical protein
LCGRFSRRDECERFRILAKRQERVLGTILQAHRSRPSHVQIEYGNQSRCRMRPLRLPKSQFGTRPNRPCSPSQKPSHRTLKRPHIESTLRHSRSPSWCGRRRRNDRAISVQRCVVLGQMAIVG